MKLTTAQLDRASGAILGMAAGDALGAPFEFGPPLPSTHALSMTGGGGFGWAPGEWTDDTSMAMPILQAAAAGRDLSDEAVLDDIVAAWVDWARTAPDVGIQLRAVLSSRSLTAGAPMAAAVRAVARAHHDRHGRSAGNGSLMRTAPVGIAFLDDADATAQVARAISDLTHFEADAGDACVLWCLAIRHAVLTGLLDVRVGLASLPADRRELWSSRIVAAEDGVPSDFSHNGWVVEAFQGAWSALIHSQHLVSGIEAAVRGGRDTDTVAAIAGALAGAAYGGTALPAAWRRVVHGWPGLRANDLVRLGILAARGGLSDVDGWPAAEHFDYEAWGVTTELARHPDDPGVWLGGVGALDALPAEVDAVVSLCRIGSAQVPSRIVERVEVMLLDRPDPQDNLNLEFVLTDTADLVATLRAEGKTVLVHCVQGRSRTPTIGALYAIRHRGIPAGQALRHIGAVMPNADPNSAFRAVIAAGRAAVPSPEIVIRAGTR
jgi:ADP-ribosylglycohydrolase